MKVLFFLILFTYFDNLSGVSITPDKIANPSEKVNIAVSTGGKIELTWDKSTSVDILCYNVYVSKNSGGPYTKVNPQILPKQKFVIVYNSYGQKVSAWLGDNTTTATMQYKSPYVVKILETPEISCTFEDKKRVKSNIFRNYGVDRTKQYYTVSAVNFFGKESLMSNELEIVF